MKESKWYSIKRKNIFVVSYNIINRIICFIIILLIVILYAINKYYMRNEISQFYEIIIGVLIFFLLILILLVDKYKFDFLKKKVVIYKGIFPIVTKEKFYFEQIRSLKINELLVRKKKYYELVLVLKNSQTRRLGIYRNFDKLNQYISDFRYYKSDVNLLNEVEFTYL
jgi:hypothetical protein